MTAQFQISLAGSEATYACDEGDTLLRAGLRQGLLEGEVDDLFPDAPGLRPKERERGKRLACQCVPTSNCTIKIRSGAEYASAIRPRRFAARFTGCVSVTPDMSIFSFSADTPAEFLAGNSSAAVCPAAGSPTICSTPCARATR